MGTRCACEEMALMDLIYQSVVLKDKTHGKYTMMQPGGFTTSSNGKMDRRIYTDFSEGLCGHGSGAVGLALFLLQGKEVHKEKLCHFIESWNVVPWALDPIERLLQRETVYFVCVP